jgi:antirestriction protein ArdC
MTHKNHQEQKASDMQSELLAKALEKATRNDGMFLNADRRKAPSLFPRGKATTGFNALILGLKADEGQYKTGIYTLFNEAKKAELSIKTKEHGTPVMFTKWDTYANVKNPDVTVSKDEYKTMSDTDKALYRPKPTRELRILFNLDQTTMPTAKADDYATIVKCKGSIDRRPTKTEDEAVSHVAVNDFLLKMKDNLVEVKLDSTGMGRYDPTNDIVLLPQQSHFNNYEDYAQEVFREVITATGHQQRLARQGVEMPHGKVPMGDAANREQLIVELASAIKMQQMGMAARLSPKSQALVPEWTKAMKENPNYLDSVTVSVNSALDVIAKAERGEKVEYASVRNQQQTDKLTEAIGQKGAVTIENVQMMKDDNDRWTIFIKPVGQPAFNLYPEPNDVNRFFATVKNGPEEAIDKICAEMAQKYYALGTANPQLKVDLFGKDTPQADLDRIDKASIYRTKDDKLLIAPTIDGNKQKPRQLTPAQWQRAWLSDDMDKYKTTLAATIYKDVLHPELAEKQEQGQDTAEVVSHPDESRKPHDEEKPKETENKQQEPKAKEEKESKGKEGKAKSSPVIQQYLDLKKKHPDAMLLFRNGDFYETYKEDAEKSSKILGITLTKNSKVKGTDGKAVAMAVFPFQALDTYLPKLIRSGERVAICDIEENRKRKSNVTEQVAPATQKTEAAKEETQDEEQQTHRGMRR